MPGLKVTAVLAVLLTSCVTASVITPPGGTVDFKQYKAVSLVVLGLGAHAFTPYSIEGIRIFESWLKDMLRSQGYSVVERDEDMSIAVAVTSFRPGRKLLGMYLWSYGFGENMPELTYRATFRDRSGILIAVLEGGRSYHGYELTENPKYMTEDQIRMAMIRHSVTQIGQFIQNNGRLE